eukprot:scaffold389_cov382-Prasinococcus_capsulatus_cf.AAC.24
MTAPTLFGGTMSTLDRGTVGASSLRGGGEHSAILARMCILASFACSSATRMISTVIPSTCSSKPLALHVT